MSEDKLPEVKFYEYAVPVTYTTTGWVKVKGRVLEEAKVNAKELEEEGVEYFSIHDPEVSVELHIDEIEEIKEPPTEVEQVAEMVANNPAFDMKPLKDYAAKDAALTLEVYEKMPVEEEDDG